MASDSPALNFVEYMKGVGDAAVNLAKEGAYGVYDFGQVAVGGGKILAKEGLSAMGAHDAAAAIVLDDIQPLSSLGKVAAQGGYQGLGEAVKGMPGNVANAVADAVRQGDMRALGSAVTDAVLLADGAVGTAKGLAAGARRVGGAAGKAKTALAKAAESGNPEAANDGWLGVANKTTRPRACPSKPTIKGPRLAKRPRTKKCCNNPAWSR